MSLSPFLDLVPDEAAVADQLPDVPRESILAERALLTPVRGSSLSLSTGPTGRT